MTEESVEAKFNLVCSRWKESQDLVRQLTEIVKTLKSQPQIPEPPQSPELAEVPPTTYLGDFDTRYVELQKENQLLNQLIKQYESTLEVVMGKFRNQAQAIQKEKHELQLKLERALKDERTTITDLRAQNALLQAQLGASLSVMRDAVAVDDTNIDSLLTGLAKENEGLREMLGVKGDSMPIAV